MCGAAFCSSGASGTNRSESAGRQLAWTEPVLDYVLRRQNRDGGYTFARGTDSNAQDTFYALKILRVLDSPPPHVSKTIKRLRGFPTNTLYGCYYVSQGLRLCGESVGQDFAERVLAFRRCDGSFGTMEVFVAAPSEFNSTFMAVQALNAAGSRGRLDATIDWLLGHRNDDGGFGAHSRSNLRSTFHAIVSLHHLAFQVNSLRTTRYVRSCELPSGGFSILPGGLMPYMDGTYCGVLALDVLGERCSHPSETAKRVHECFNSNGGFRRSVELGISTLEDTCYALTILRKVANVD